MEGTRWKSNFAGLGLLAANVVNIIILFWIISINFFFVYFMFYFLSYQKDCWEIKNTFIINIIIILIIIQIESNMI